ncbi:GGDEF domain-containing protein, partial [Saccharothrix coeruleofusca]
VNLKSLWVFASVIVLPLPLVMALTVISYLYCWLRVYGHTMVFRKVFSAATFVLASGASAAVLDATGLVVRPGIPEGPLGALALVAAAAVWWLVNFALVVGAIVLSNPTAPASRAVGDLADQLVVAAALGLGVGLAALLVFAPWLVAVLMVTVLALHQGLLMPQLQRAAQTDGKTGLMEATYWSRMAGAELARARQHGRPVAMLVLDLDHFRQVNNEHGHVAGDQVLRAAAAVLRGELRRGDLVGRFGGDELVVLLPGATAGDVRDIAARILDRLRALVVAVPTVTGQVEITGLTASMGAALSPDHGTEVDQLILVADQALLRAKRTGRDRLCLAS